MFDWYVGVDVCYVYLGVLDSDCPLLRDDSPDVDAWLLRFEKCAWSIRGWTLQELLASRKFQFHSSRWNKMASLLHLASTVFEVTKIGVGLLLHSELLDGISIAGRMSWAANREPSPVEDRAYSLLGIFNVNMPMLYGEKEKAF